MSFLHDRVAEDGHELEFFTCENVTTKCHHSLRRLVFPWMLWRHAANAAKAGRPYDVVNVHEPSGAIIALRRRSAGNPMLIVTSHGIEDRGWQQRILDARLGRAPLRLRTRFYHPLSRLVPSRISLRNADHVCCLNEEDRKYIRSTYGKSSTQITRLFPGASDVFIESYSRREYHSSDRILVFGTWLTRKGSTEVVTAFKTLAERRENLKLILIGTGYPTDVVLDSFPENLRRRIEVYPTISDAESVQMVLAASVYWLPSLFEGTPLTLMETMATGMPVIASATCGMKDVIQDGINGLLIPTRDARALIDATERFLDDQPLRERLGRKAHEDVTTSYSWDYVAEQLRALYNAIAQNRSQAGGTR